MFKDGSQFMSDFPFVAASPGADERVLADVEVSYRMACRLAAGEFLNLIDQWAAVWSNRGGVAIGRGPPSTVLARNLTLGTFTLSLID